jgi:hypothetical protein
VYLQPLYARNLQCFIEWLQENALDDIAAAATEEVLIRLSLDGVSK